MEKYFFNIRVFTNICFMAILSVAVYLPNIYNAFPGWKVHLKSLTFTEQSVGPKDCLEYKGYVLLVKYLQNKSPFEPSQQENIITGFELTPNEIACAEVPCWV